MFARMFSRAAPAAGIGTTSAPDHGRQRSFRAALAALELVEIAKAENRPAPRLLDIGGAHGIHARFFRKHIPRLAVDIIDVKPTDEPLVFTGLYEDFAPAAPYDFIWASHVLEHVQNPGLFLQKLRRDLKPGGWIGLTVPPLKHEMTFAHVTLWNAGLLLINLIRSGFECTGAHVATYDYNVSVLVQKTGRRIRPHDAALPPGVSRSGRYFEGRIERLNWSIDSLAPFTPKAPVPAGARALDLITAYPDHDFVRIANGKAPAAYLALDHETAEAHLVR